MKSDNKFNDKDKIYEVLKEEIEKANEGRTPIASKLQLAYESEAIWQTYQTFVNQYCEHEFSYKVSKALFNSINRLNFDYGQTHLVIELIKDELEQELFFTQLKLKKVEPYPSKEFEETKDFERKLKTAIGYLPFETVNYFWGKLRKELDKHDLPEKLKLVKRSLIQHNSLEENVSVDSKYFVEALLNFKNDIESEIELQQEEIQLRNKIGKIEKDQTTRKHKDLTLDRATIFFSYLFTYLKSNTHNTAKADTISFLTGYSKNTVVQKLSNLHKKEGKNFLAYEKDLVIVRKHFNDLGLSEVVKMIDRDLKG